MKNFLLILAVLFATIGAAHAQVAVIANQNVPVDAVDGSALEDIFTLEQNRWSDGERIVRFDLQGDEATTETFYSELGTSLNAIRRVWLQKQLTGEAQPPESVGSGEMVQRVSSTPSAIGYVAAEAVTDDVKVLLTID